MEIWPCSNNTFESPTDDTHTLGEREREKDKKQQQQHQATGQTNKQA